MKIAITGASGYVGGKIAACLESHGHQVLRLSRRQCPGEWQSFSLSDPPSSIPWEHIDGFIHAAHDFTPQTWDEHEEKNIIPSKALFAAAKAAGIRHLTFISSLSAFEGCASLYGAAKIAIEKEALHCGATVIRSGLVWGSQSGGMMGALAKASQKLPILPYPAGPGGLRQYLIHEQDLAEAVVFLTLRRHPAEIVNIAHPAPLTLRELMQCIAAQHQQRRIFIPVPWWIVMAGLKIAERANLTLPFRSDSLIGLVRGNPSVVIHPEKLPFEIRPFPPAADGVIQSPQISRS